MTMPTPNPRAQARHLLSRLTGASRRDRAAYVAGFVAAFNAMAGALPAVEYGRLGALAAALHDICAEEYE